ncbi:hypothetical protein XENOCAPTIV_006862, partial [Xenoophorus captivus]
LHLRVQLLLILLHDVRQVRAPAALAVIIFIVTIVRLVIITKTQTHRRSCPLRRPRANPSSSSSSSSEGCW